VQSRAWDARLRVRASRTALRRRVIGHLGVRSKGARTNSITAVRAPRSRDPDVCGRYRTAGEYARKEGLCDISHTSGSFPGKAGVSWQSGSFLAKREFPGNWILRGPGGLGGPKTVVGLRLWAPRWSTLDADSCIYLHMASAWLHHGNSSILRVGAREYPSGQGEYDVSRVGFIRKEGHSLNASFSWFPGHLRDVR
jgi:hypothetical protein